MSAEILEPTVNSKAIADDFVAAMKGKMDNDKLDRIVNDLSKKMQTYSANGAVASVIFYLKFQVQIKGGKNFKGDAGGAAFPGGGALFGDVYTNDLDKLYRDTKTFQFTATPVYLSMLFFDGKQNLLGHFQSGAVSTVIGTGGGTGSWK